MDIYEAVNILRGQSIHYNEQYAHKTISGIRILEKKEMLPEIVDVKYNGPATIVFWADKTKTIVKCAEDEYFDPEKGLAMAITKKALGNQGNYFETIKKWLPKPNENSDTPYTDLLKTMLGVKKEDK